MLLEQQKAGEIPLPVKEAADQPDHRRNLVACGGRLRRRDAQLLSEAAVVIGIKSSDQLVLVRVVPIQRADGNAGALGDHRHRSGVHPQLGEQVQRRLVDAALELTLGSSFLHHRLE